uniref:uncharacterized protein LOC114597214 isoform X3 n=1 Tax=Podarcis muralis TaxID=64176 RepID=UPI0010A079E0|nr:uncharacterized protein LOC114597214 isoform X3 [Podarcis muralis]
MRLRCWGACVLRAGARSRAARGVLWGCWVFVRSRREKAPLSSCPGCPLSLARKLQLVQNAVAWLFTEDYLPPHQWLDEYLTTYVSCCVPGSEYPLE